MNKLKFVYNGLSKEVQVNSPYKQRFINGVEVGVEQEMAIVLRTHPDFKEIDAKPKKDLTEEEILKGMFPEERRKFLEDKYEALGWPKFQKWAHDNFGVKDTSRKELFDEIIVKIKEES